MKSNRRFTLGFHRFSGLYFWALFIVVFTIWEPHIFPTMNTVHAVASEQAITGLLALAVLVPLVGGAYDLSVGAVANLTTIVVAWLQTVYHWPMWPAILMSLVAAAAIGAVNGFIVVRLKVNSFITTLGMATIALAVEQIISGTSQPLPPVIAAWGALTQRTVFGFQVVFIYLIAISVILYWVLEKTPPGRFLHAVGGNSEAARLSGVSVDKWVWLSFIVSATIAGVAGVLFSSLSGSSLSYGPGMLLPAFAAAFLGSTQLRPGRFNVWGTVLAVYILATGVEGLSLVTGVQWLSGMFNGVALIVAVAFAGWSQRARLRRRRTDHVSAVRAGANEVTDVLAESPD